MGTYTPVGPCNLANILGEKCSRDDPSAEAEYFCRWEDRWYYASWLVGGLLDTGAGLFYQPPQCYGDLNGLICHDVKIEKVGSLAGQTNPPLAKLVASFGAPRCHNALSTTGDPMDTAEIEIAVSGEGMPIPKKDVEWASDAPGALAGTPLREDEDISPSKMMPFVELSIKCKYMQTWNLDDISSIVGKVNQATINMLGSTFEPGTLLLIGVAMQQTITAQGYEQFERDIKVGIRRDASGTYGWNHLYIPDYDTYATTDPPLYLPGDFSILAN